MASPDAQVKARIRELLNGLVSDETLAAVQQVAVKAVRDAHAAGYREGADDERDEG